MGTPAAIPEPFHAALFKKVSSHPHARPGTARRIPGLEQCQIETPLEWVRLVWRLVNEQRANAGSVVDFGAGDGRFGLYGNYESYTGYEIDRSKPRCKGFPSHAKIVHADAATAHEQWDTAVGNPPYARNQDLDASWRDEVQRRILEETGRKVHGLQNLYQYFLWLAIMRTTDDGLVALIVPQEWVSRPSAQPLRAHIRDNNWAVRVYRLPDTRDLFSNEVKTTASITIIDKRTERHSVVHYNIGKDRMITEASGPTRSGGEVLPYVRHRGAVYANRGFSPGSQAIFCLTEDERKASGITKWDVVKCVTTLRHIPRSVETLSDDVFREHYIDAGEKCWLIKADSATPRKPIMDWFAAAPESVKQNSTCSLRKVWHQYTTPAAPDILYAAGFRGDRPKIVENPVGARNVGSVHGIFRAGESTRSLVRYLRRFDFGDVIVPHAHGLMKVEVRQMNGVLNEYHTARGGR